MAKDKRLRRDLAGVGPDPDDARRRLISLDDLEGYTMAAGEPDVRGWEVRTLSGRDLGEVEDLLVDPDRGEIVMLEVDMRGEGVHAEVPLRSVQLDRDRKVVLVDSGELDTRNDMRARDRVDAVERDRIRDDYRDTSRDVRYGSREEHPDTRNQDERDELARNQIARERAERDQSARPVGDDGVEETVVERRPVIEEVVVRRRVVDTE